MNSPGCSSSTVPRIRTIALPTPDGLSRFKDRTVRSGMEFEMTGVFAGPPANVPVETKDDGVLVLEISGWPDGFRPQPDATMAVSAQAKISRKL